MKIALAWVDLSDPTDRAVALGLAGALRREGHAVCLVGPRRRPGEAPREVVEGFTTRRVGPREDLQRVHEEEAVDVWHCHVFARDHGAFVRAARRGKWRVLATLHLILEDYLPFVGGVRGMQGLLEAAERVTTVSRAARRDFLARFPGWKRRTDVVYNGTVAPAVGRARRVAKPFILCVARLAPYKGPDLLALAFARVLDEHPELRLVYCGRDQTKGGIKRLVRALGIERSVVFAGGVTPATVAALTRDCAFVVLPSRRENFPLALLEAMRAGKAVVASATGGVVELVRDRVDGLLAPAGDVPALAARLAELAGDAALRRRLGDAARVRGGRFTWERAARAYGRLYARRSSGIRLKKKSS